SSSARRRGSRTYWSDTCYRSRRSRSSGSPPLREFCGLERDAVGRRHDSMSPIDPRGVVASMTLDEIDLANPEAYLAGVPHEQFALLRREAPVFWHREENGPGFWALARHADIPRVARDQTTFRQAPALFIEDLPPNNLHNSPNVM